MATIERVEHPADPRPAGLAGFKFRRGRAALGVLRDTGHGVVALTPEGEVEAGAGRAARTTLP